MCEPIKIENPPDKVQGVPVGLEFCRRHEGLPQHAEGVCKSQ